MKTDTNTPHEIEPIVMQVNALYWTRNRKMAHCTDLRMGLFLCEIDGENHYYYEDGSPAWSTKRNPEDYTIEEHIKR